MKQYPIKVKETGNIIPVFNYIIKQSAKRAYEGVEE
jgi:hypothetical protein